MGEIFALLLGSAEGAFLEVGVFVGAILLLFALIDYHNNGRFVGYIEKAKRWQPVIGAVLGLTPGCGGAIFVMPLFFKGSVTFGTVVAALMATMGDAAFVLMAASPYHYLLVSLWAFAAAVSTGYAVDRTELGTRLLGIYRSRQPAPHAQAAMEMAVAEITLPSARSKFSQYLILTFWVLTGVGLTLGVAALAQIDVNELPVPNLGTVVGIAGTAIAIGVTLGGRKMHLSGCKRKTIQSTLMQGFLDTAFVITWVFLGYMAYELLVLGVGRGDYLIGEQMIESVLLSVGVVSVFVAVAVGIIPGCGPQIIFVSLFVQGLVPFSALLANAISQDGDALFPVLAMDHRSAAWATLLNKLPALAMGLIFYVLEKQM